MRSADRRILSPNPTNSISINHFHKASHLTNHYLPATMTDPEQPPSPGQTAAREGAEQERKAAEAAEQAQLPYTWTQSIGDVDVTVPVSGSLKGRDLDVSLTKAGIKVGVKGEEAILKVHHHPLPAEKRLRC